VDCAAATKPWLLRVSQIATTRLVSTIVPSVFLSRGCEVAHTKLNVGPAGKISSVCR
jgi:hypothetical protein